MKAIREALCRPPVRDRCAPWWAALSLMVCGAALPPPAGWCREPTPDARMAVPGDAEIAAARDLVRQAYEEKFSAADLGKPGDLVAVLAAVADKTDLPARKFAALAEAERVAAAAGDMGLAIDLVLKRAATFRIDPMSESLAAVARCLDENRKTNPHLLGGVIDQGLRLATAATSADRLEDALTAVDMAADAAKTVTLAAKPGRKAIKDQRLADMAASATKQAEIMNRGIRRRIKARNEMREAAEKLEIDPNDAAANGVVGAYECFVLGDWQSGLPRLALADSIDLKQVATDELRICKAESPPVTEVFTLAGRWWASAASPGVDEDTANAIKRHAASLYASLLDKLSDPLDIEIAKKRSRGAQERKPLRSGAAATARPGAYLARRDESVRSELVAARGGNEKSEAAVEAALKWILSHQMADGGWCFEFRDCPDCKGQCGNSGSKRDDRCAATALALLPFLGRGYTHKDGPYKAQFEAGVAFLAGLARKGEGNAAAAGGGGAYSQGLAGICLSEAYGMTQDGRLQLPAQNVLNHIMAWQDPAGGGWGYQFKSPGDTSISGWQLMALKSGTIASLKVSPATVNNTSRFLDSVADDGGAFYGYRTPGRGPGTTAIGLLCRIHLGWQKDHPALRSGVEFLGKKGPSSDLYYDYYANQVMHHMEGDVWQSWNAKMQKMLLEAQATAGHESGSWFRGVDGGHGGHVGGRLYCTSLATLILESYYRNAPAK